MHNESVLVAIVICSLVIYVVVTDNHEFTPRKRVCNDIDGRCYDIADKYYKTKEASEILAQLNDFGINVMRHLRRKYIWNDSGNPHGKEIVEYLLSNYNPDTIIENAPINDVNTSYVDDKGKVFALCLREKESGDNNFHSMDLLKFVVLHEMSHMATESFGHEVDFWTHFKFLLKEAKAAGLYNPVDYNKQPIVYCSLKVSYNPYFDNRLKNL